MSDEKRVSTALSGLDIIGYVLMAEAINATLHADPAGTRLYQLGLIFLFVPEIIKVTAKRYHAPAEGQQT